MIDDMTRRLFLQGSSMAAGAVMVALRAEGQEAEGGKDPRLAEEAAIPPTGLAVIGAGSWGKEILRRLAQQKHADLKHVIDISEPALRGAAKVLAGAEGKPEPVTGDDYKKALDDQAVQAVIVATPSHLHKQIVLDALAAGKHVYCEAPLASSIDDAKAIAQAAKAKEGELIFQSGLQLRAADIYEHVMKFVRTGVLDKLLGARAQWHRKESWYRTSPDAERERELNWKLYHETSGGLPNEVAIHQVDFVSWMAKTVPTSVMGYGSKLIWKEDDREIADTVGLLYHYDLGRRNPVPMKLNWDGSLGNSFEGNYEVLYGSDGTLLTKGDRAWLFKESDAPTLGWEVYARQEKVADEQGIVLIANSTKLIDAGLEPSKVGNVASDPLLNALRRFQQAIHAEDKTSPVDAATGFEATVVGLKSQEAVTSGAAVTIDPELLKLD